MRRFLFACGVLAVISTADAQVLQLTRDQLVQYTPANPFDRSADGRPKVPDELPKRLQNVSGEKIWTILHKHGYDNQYADGWRILHPEKHRVSRALTVQFMPRREDVQKDADDAEDGQARSSDIYPRPHDPELLKQYEAYKKEHLKDD
jgi:hypothetical protein